MLRLTFIFKKWWNNFLSYFCSIACSSSLHFFCNTDLLNVKQPMKEIWMCTHMRRHNPEKLFKCNHCNYEGIQTAILDSHIQSTHNNLWYHCDLCEYKANHNCNITKHVEIKHEGLVFGCDDCDNKSTSNARVAVHEESYYKGIR